jgi:hypothetical protein
MALWLGLRWHISAGWPVAFVAVLSTPVVRWLTIACHEAGHAAVAIRRGRRVKRVTVGTGHPLVSRRIRRAEVVLQAWPDGGRTGYATSERTTVADALAIARAGPAAHVVLLALALPGLVYGGTASSTAALLFGAWQLIFFIDNVRVRPPRCGDQGNDGWQIKQLRIAEPGARQWDYQERRMREAVKAAPDLVSRHNRLVKLGGLQFEHGNFGSSAASYQAARDLLPATHRLANLIGGQWAEATLCALLSAQEPMTESTLRTCEGALARAAAVRSTPSSFGAALLALASGKPAVAQRILSSMLSDGRVAEHAEPVVKAALSLALSSLGSPHAGSWLVGLSDEHPLVRAAQLQAA